MVSRMPLYSIDDFFKVLNMPDSRAHSSKSCSSFVFLSGCCLFFHPNYRWRIDEQNTHTHTHTLIWVCCFHPAWVCLAKKHTDSQIRKRQNYGEKRNWTHTTQKKTSCMLVWQKQDCVFGGYSLFLYPDTIRITPFPQNGGTHIRFCLVESSPLVKHFSRYRVNVFQKSTPLNLEVIFPWKPSGVGSPKHTFLDGGNIAVFTTIAHVTIQYDRTPQKIDRRKRNTLVCELQREFFFKETVMRRNFVRDRKGWQGFRVVAFFYSAGIKRDHSFTKPMCR